MEKFVFTCIFCFFGSALIGQAKLIRPLVWAPGDPIGAVWKQIIPISSNLHAPPGATIDFSIRFGDLDNATCLVEGTKRSQFYNPGYKVTLTSSSPKARFIVNVDDPPSSTAVLEYLGHDLLDNPYPPFLVPPRKFAFFVYSSAALHIDASWVPSETIQVTATVEDISDIPSNPGDSGSPIDPTAVIQTWTLNHSTLCPTRLERVNLFPGDNTWSQPPVDFTYRCLVNPPPAYENHIVSEVFSEPKGDGVFSFENDLLFSWKDAHKNVLTADDAAKIIFERSSSSASFAINKDNQFTDTHNHGFIFKEGILPINNVFTASAIANHKVGFKVEQTFLCGTSIIGAAEIFRRRHGISGLIEVRKKH